MLAKIDKTSGSMAYNRLDMQVSQSLLFAIELYDSLDYLIVLDYYDDITIFEGEDEDSVVRYYQMKTSDKIITIHTVLGQEWLPKLYEHLENPKNIIRELGLISNQYITDQIKTAPGKKPLNKKIFSSDMTKFNTIHDDTKKKICEDIARRKQISPDEVDLSKLIYLKTELTINSHKDLAEKKLIDFLSDSHPKMSISIAKTIYAALAQLLSSKQAFELGESAPFDAVKAHKSFSKKLVNKIIDVASIIELPAFQDVLDKGRITDEYKDKAASAYITILADSNRNDELFNRTFDVLRKIIQIVNPTIGEPLWDYAGRCFEEYAKDNQRNIHVLTADLYINVLVLCILVKGED